MLGLPDPGREDLAPPSIDILAVASPAAGANATIPLGEFELFAILGCRFNFTADANAANRVVCVDYIAGGVTWLRNGAGQGIRRIDDHSSDQAADRGRSFRPGSIRTTLSWGSLRGAPTLLEGSPRSASSDRNRIVRPRPSLH